METTAASPAAQHPIRLVVNDDLQRTRLTVFFRLILAIPHLVWLNIWRVIAVLAVVVNWFATLIKGRSPDGLHNFLAAYRRYKTHLSAYLLIVANPYPGFTGKLGTYPIDLEIDPPQRQNRLTVFFRFVLAIPALLMWYVLTSVSQLLAIFSWFIAVVTGRVPEGLRNFGALALRIETQAFGYLFLQTGRYPSFNVGVSA
jgi:Domain of unknown function (DUF4389)